MREFFGSVEIFLYLICGNVTSIYTSKKLRIIQLKKVDFTLCKGEKLKTFLKSLLGLFVSYRGRKFSGFKHTIKFLNLHHLRIIC